VGHGGSCSCVATLSVMTTGGATQRSLDTASNRLRFRATGDSSASLNVLGRTMILRGVYLEYNATSQGIRTGGSSMRASMIACVTLIACAGTAVAADFPAVPYRAPPIPYQRAYDWSGFYIGVNAGGGWANATSDFRVDAL